MRQVFGLGTTPEDCYKLYPAARELFLWPAATSWHPAGTLLLPPPFLSTVLVAQWDMDESHSWTVGPRFFIAGTEPPGP